MLVILVQLQLGENHRIDWLTRQKQGHINQKKFNSFILTWRQQKEMMYVLCLQIILICILNGFANDIFIMISTT